MKKITLALFFLFNIAFAMAQLDSVMISGVVYDYDTREAIKGASFKLNGEFIDISEDGKFQVYVKPNDSLAFKFTGYKDYKMIIPNDMDQVSYISGIFLNKTDIDESKIIVVPREYNVESLATYDPSDRQVMMENANRNVAVAAYQATQPYEWDAHENTKNAIASKDLEIEYKGGVAPTQMVGVSTSTTLQNPLGNIKIYKFGEKGYEKASPISPKEEFYIKALFDASLSEQ